MKLSFLFLIIFLIFLLSGCGYFAHKPFEMETYDAFPDKKQENLIVFLRGLGGSHRSFEAEGMVAEVKKRGLPFDIVAPNAHFGYYSARTLVQRLDDDIIVPAISDGYKNIWLVGVSMGGLGALLFLKERPLHVSGVYLISPFLGYEKIITEIAGAGGLVHWKPGNYDADDDWQRMLWQWLQEVVSRQNTAPVILGYGNADSYVTGQKQLAQVLQETDVIEITGAHDFPTFKKLWVLFLERDYLVHQP